MAISDTALDEGRLQEFVGRFAGDLGAALHQTTVLIGDKLGLYAAMSDGEPVTPGELAARTGTDERYVREWLCAQAASGYVEYDADSERFFLTPEQAACLADPESPTFLPGAFYIAASCVRDEPKITERFRTGEGLGWHEHDGDLLLRDRAVLPARLRREPRAVVAARARRRRGEAAGRCAASPTSAAATAPRRS